MKLSPLILSMVIAGVSADRLGATPRASRATTTTHVRHLKEEEVATNEKDAGNDGVGQCGQCKKADECLPNYECVSATESGCFNFDASADNNLYCVLGPTAAPTVAPTDAPTVTPAPTAAATTGAPTAAATSTSAPTVVIPPGVGTCGQCEETADCSEGHLCVMASDSGCFNFDVSDRTDMYCAAVFNASNGTDASTAAPSEAATTVMPTSSPSEAASTTAPTAAATTTAPTSTVTSTSTTGPTAAGTTPEPMLGTIRYIGGDPDIAMRVCEGDCDNDDECEDNLVCMQRSGNEPIPGCGGSPREAADYCVLPPGRSSVVAAAQEAPSSDAVAVGTKSLAIASAVALLGSAVISMF